MSWFSSVPAHWGTPPVYARFEVQLGKMLDERKITKQFLAPYLRNTDVQWDGINVDDLPEMDFDEGEQQLYSLRPGDILMCEGGEIGRCAIWNSDRRCFYQKALHRLRPTTSKDDPRYFVLVMRAAVEAGLFTSQASAATIQHLPAEKLRIVRYPAPPINEQRAIVDYVSRHTGRIDALVAAKQCLLDLLAEKRKAIIATAVTRGLDPTVKLRDSGVPWLDEIPVHWDVWKVGHLARVGNGSTPERDKAAYWSEGAFPWLNSSVVNQEDVKSSEQFVTETALRECHLPRLQPGTVLVAITGQGKTRGQAVVLSIEATINQHIAFVAPDPNLISAWFLRWSFYRAYEYLRSISDDAGGTKGALTCEDVANLRIPVPTLDEQHAIVEHIARETAKLNAVRAATERTIALLKERRAALIAAAVTGQLDVGAAA